MASLRANLRQDMPTVASWIDELRAVFCTTPAELASFNANIKAGMDGQPTFYACENGHEVGTKDLRPGVSPVIITKAQREAEEALRGTHKPARSARA